jgi:hypothetical protein
LTKAYLLNQLENHHHSWALALAAVKLFFNPSTIELLRGQKVRFGTFELELDQVVADLNNPTDQQLVVDQFLKSHLRSFVRDPFENIKVYCKGSGQVAELKLAPWYHFARLIRNSLAHDFHVAFRPDDRALLPVAWRGITITAAMEGTELTLTFFGIPDAVQLFLDMREFVQSALA